MTPLAKARRMVRIESARELLEARGTVWTEWAAARGWPLESVRSVLRAERPCLRGDSRRIANMMLAEAEAEGVAAPEASPDTSNGDLLSLCRDLLRGSLDRELALLADCADSEAGMACVPYSRNDLAIRCGRLAAALERLDRALEGEA